MSDHKENGLVAGDIRGVVFLTRSIMLAALCLLTYGCIAPLPDSVNIETGKYIKKLDISVKGVRRSYLVHVPPGYHQGESLPMVIVVHGAFSTAEEMERQSGFSGLSDKDRFLAVYPNGAFGIFGFFQHWNAGHCCGPAASENIDDVGFLDSVIADVRKSFDVDARRIYMAGFSNGGMLAYRYAAERSQTVAAVAVAAASIGGRSSEDAPLWVIPHPSGPVPMMVFHGMDDRNVPYDGGRSPRGGKREYLSVEKSVNFWVLSDDCVTTPRTELLYNGAVEKKAWTCRNNREDVVLFSIKGWGHKWPGRYFTGKPGDDNPLIGFDAAEIIWPFLKIRALGQTE